jgi:hypothetical protein
MQALKLVLFIRDNTGTSLDPNFKEAFTEAVLDLIEEYSCEGTVLYNELSYEDMEYQIEEFKDEAESEHII